jgi:hypothetical protein
MPTRVSLTLNPGNSSVAEQDLLRVNCTSGRYLDPAEAAKSLIVSAYSGFPVVQEAARRMLPKRDGAIPYGATPPRCASNGKVEYDGNPFYLDTSVL